MSTEYSISVIVITWNQADLTTKCLESIEKGFDFERDEIIVVDNGSSDGTREVIQDRFPGVRYVHLKANIGVGPARNKGIVASTKNIIMTLDNDAYLTTPFSHLRESIVQSFGENRNLGVMGFRLCYPNGEYQFNGRQFPRLLQPFTSRLAVLRKFAYFRKLHSNHLRFDLEQFSEGLYEVDYVLGANQIFERRTAVCSGIYNEAIFYGPEDLEFCWEVKNSGYRNMVNMDVIIFHDYQRRSSASLSLFMKHTLSFYKSWAKMNVYTHRGYAVD